MLKKFNLNFKISRIGKAVTIAVHSGGFHADDVCAVAALKIMLGDRARVQIKRTRDMSLIFAADYVVDVGGIHDAGKNRFDHHQSGGAGERANGIPYAAFGLVWLAYGEKIAGSKQAADMIEEKLVMPTDANDNGVSISKEVFPDIRSYDLSSIVRAMNPNWDEEGKNAADGDLLADKNFLEAVALAEKVLMREIESAHSVVEGEKFTLDAYEKTSDKRIIVLDGPYPWGRVISKFPEPLFVVYPKHNVWRIYAVRNNLNSFENRKNLPAAWAGKRDAELSAIAGVPGALFCHNKLFTASAETKEAALAMAAIAVANT